MRGSPLTARAVIPVFIPFAGCPHKCVFCDQKRITGANRPPAPENIGRIVLDWRARFKPEKIESDPPALAYYGGTFTGLPENLFMQYLDAARRLIEQKLVAYTRVSTRPDFIDDSICSKLLSQGVREVELGVQSMTDAVLDGIARGYKSADVDRSARLIKSAGLRLGVQLMPGLPGDSRAAFLESVRNAIKLGADFARLYPAVALRGTELWHRMESGRFNPLPVDTAADWCAEAMIIFRQANVPVIRTGLPMTELEPAGVAGPIHPAFGAIVKSKMFYRLIAEALETAGPGSVVLKIHPADFSSAVGHKKSNLDRLKTEYGFVPEFLADDSLARETIRTNRGSLHSFTSG